jgi:hypothetical protein
MKTLALPAYQSFVHSKNKHAKSEVITNAQPDTKEKDGIKLETKASWFNPEASENLTVKECIIRAALVMTMPMLSAIDWNYGTHTLIFIIPAIFYLEVTAFTMNCPIKALFSNYSHPPKFE